MTWKDVIAIVWSVLNSPLGITVAGAVIVWLLARVFAWRPAWKRYEGTIISAIKAAEKAIPDGTPNGGAAKLDRAMQFVLRAYEQATGLWASAKLKNSIREGIQIVHDELEARKTL